MGLKIAGLATALLGIALSSCSQGNMPIKDIKTLVVNTSTAYRTSVMQSEEGGVREIRELVNTSPLEEAWAYLPKNNLWVEVGRNEKSEKKVGGKFFSSIDIDGVNLGRLIENNNELMLYHFHPKGSKSLEYWIDKKEKEGDPIEKEIIPKLETIITVNNVTPSENDILYMIKSSKIFYERHPKGKIIHKVCSSHGVTEFSLTADGGNFYKNIGQKDVALYRSIFAGTRPKVDHNQPDDISKIKKYCEDLSLDPMINITFKSYEEFLANSLEDK